MNRAEKRRQQKLAAKAAQSAGHASDQQTLSIQQAIDLGVEHHHAGRLAEAENIYRQVLQVEPDHPVGLHLLGVIAHQNGNDGVAVDLVRKALALEPNFADAHNTLGNALKGLNDMGQAIENYRQAIVLNPDFAVAHDNLGLALVELNKLDEAIECFRKALALNPGSAEAHLNLGNALKDQGKPDEAIASYRKALNLAPGFAKAHLALGSSLVATGEKEEACSCFNKALELDTGDVKTAAELALAHLGKMEMPSRTPEDYMQSFYKTKARSWSRVEEWDKNSDAYQGHKLISNVLASGLKDRTNLKILDAGCGTGILAALLRPHAEILDGVDLSADMLHEAKSKGLYDNLAKDDLEHYLANGDRLYDFVVAAAVLIHFSDLNLVFSRISKVLDENGQFALTLFVDDACQEFSVNSFGFFAHNPDYVKEMASRSGFTLVQKNQGVHEVHGTEEVLGTAYLFGK